MATERNCPGYKDCGYVRWRKEPPYSGIAPLPPDGDCGKVPDECCRINGKIPNVTVETYGPQSDGEIRNAFPEITGDSGRPRRLVGGGHR